MMLNVLGIILILIGLGFLISVWNEWLKSPRGSGISPEMAEFLRTPMYIHHARALARIHGFPEEDWPRFAHMAIAKIIYKVPI